MYLDKKKNGVPLESHTISVLVENRFGVLARVAGLFSGRGYNIESLTVNATVDPKVSRMTIVTTGDQAILEQIDKQLNKLIDVISVTNLSARSFIERELVLVKVTVTPESRPGIEAVLRNEGALVVIDNDTEFGVEFSGDSEHIDHFLRRIHEFGVIEVARSGRVAISRTPGRNEPYQCLEK